MRPSFEIAPAILERHPDYVAAVLVAEGVENGPSDARGEALLAEAEASLRSRGLERAAESPSTARTGHPPRARSHGATRSASPVAAGTGARAAALR